MASQPLRGPMAGLYDVFIDWPGRLGREMPGLLRHLRGIGAHRVLDAGCGTGRHLQALLDEGIDAHGADCSPEMLEQSRAVAGPERVHEWRLGDRPPPAVAALAPLDAIVSLGNVWPQLLGRGDVARTLDAFRSLLRPGGLLLLGLKVLAPRAASRNPYLPLMRREHEGRPLFFVRFLDTAAPAPDFPVDDGARFGGFHMVISGGEASLDRQAEAISHRAGWSRIWEAEELRKSIEAGGFSDVLLTHGIDGPPVDATTEDVFVRATR